MRELVQSNPILNRHPLSGISVGLLLLLICFTDSFCSAVILYVNAD